MFLLYYRYMNKLILDEKKIRKGKPVGLPVVYNDLDKSVVAMFTKAISGNREWLKTLI